MRNAKFLLFFQIILLLLIAIKLADYTEELKSIFGGFLESVVTWKGALSLISGIVCGSLIVIIFNIFSRTIKNKKPKVYISYSDKDRDIANQIIRRLSDLDVKIIDEINIGEKLEEGLERVKEDSDFFVILYTENFANSEMCNYELEKIIETDKKIFPIVDEVFLSQKVEGLKKQEVISIFNAVKYLPVDRKDFDGTMDLLVLAVTQAYNSMYDKAFRRF